MAPLDWGLGHATRCIPLIKAFSDNGCNVIIAAEGATKSLLQHEFQQLTFLPLPGYHIRYSKSKSRLPFTLLLQLPKLLYHIIREHLWLKKVVKKYHLQAVLSDNRFGLYNASLPSIYLTHQLQVKAHSKFTEQLLLLLHYFFINKYTHCWVPDFAGEHNVAGRLAHPGKIPANVHYIGCLSRFEKNIAETQVFDLLLLISGPEPQRTIFEKILLDQLPDFNGTVLLVRGLPGSNEAAAPGINPYLPGAQLTIKNHLDAASLNTALQQAGITICRSGYTTVMDLLKLKKNAILVPTPGQTEQEYLAGHLMQQGYFYSTSQLHFSLIASIEHASAFSFRVPEFKMDLYKEVVEQFVHGE